MTSLYHAAQQGFLVAKRRMGTSALEMTYAEILEA